MTLIIYFLNYSFYYHQYLCRSHFLTQCFNLEFYIFCSVLLLKFFSLFLKSLFLFLTIFYLFALDFLNLKLQLELFSNPLMLSLYLKEYLVPYSGLMVLIMVFYLFLKDVMLSFFKSSEKLSIIFKVLFPKILEQLSPFVFKISCEISSNLRYLNQPNILEQLPIFLIVMDSFQKDCPNTASLLYPHTLQ